MSDDDTAETGDDTGTDDSSGTDDRFGNRAARRPTSRRRFLAGSASRGGATLGGGTGFGASQRARGRSGERARDADDGDRIEGLVDESPGREPNRGQETTAGTDQSTGIDLPDRRLRPTVESSEAES